MLQDKSLGLQSSVVSYSRDEFLSSNFAASTFLEDHRHLQLEVLKTELNTSVKDLKHELVELINRDYADFISLSSNLTGVDAIIKDIGRPLEAMQNQVTWVRSSLQRVVDQLEAQLRTRAHIREKKAILHLLLSIHESVSKVEELLGISNQDASYTPPSGENGADVLANDDGKLIERVAIEFNQLQFFVTRGSNLPYVSNIEWRIARIKDTLTSNLSKALKAAYLKVISRPTDNVAATTLAQYLRTYVLIDKIKDAEEVFNEAVVSPFSRKLMKTHTSSEFNPQAMPSLPSSNSSNKNQTPSIIYNQIIAFAKQDCTPVLDLSSHVFKGTQHDMLVDSVWATCIAGITEKMSGVFAVGLPDVFQKNYLLAMDFVTRFESICKSRKTLSLLRLHPTYIDFMKRWQLPVYYQLRAKEIYGKLEYSTTSFEWFHANLKLDTSSTFAPFVLAPSHMMLESVSSCYNDSVFLWAVSFRFWRLTLQLVGRYILFMKSILAEVQNEAAPPVPSKDGVRSSIDTPSAQSTKAEVSDEVVLKRLGGLYRDCVMAGEQILRVGRERIAPKLTQGDVTFDSLERTLEASIEPLADIRSDATGRIVEILSKKCVESLRGDIFNIPGQYRRTNKEPPTRASYYTSSVLKPLSNFAATCKDMFGSAGLPAEWTNAILDDIVSKYEHGFTSICVEMLDSQKKISESLKRLRRVAPGKESVEDSGVMSDDDKIRLQVVLDVRQLGIECQGFGMDLTSSRTYQDLFAVISPFASLAEQPLQQQENTVQAEQETMVKQDDEKP
ncbi:hypothetical protein SmJEL517_g04076 [Synchytrium microbalum]|uniref:Conserved oligomeric Golgi complex subunit 2 n=1 Tax=Synchytrium microbalum TaxID=1806994 RepID=A0A507C5Q3_9FUNG|nr:uncharacterized protein SmJEL517_g04076 [Synchytrium microbalum]TPX32873.1 hypothetical protein SmJEL517_g04076 [Synchytrium microbalum]